MVVRDCIGTRVKLRLVIPSDRSLDRAIVLLFKRGEGFDDIAAALGVTLDRVHEAVAGLWSREACDEAAEVAS